MLSQASHCTKKIASFAVWAKTCWFCFTMHEVHDWPWWYMAVQEMVVYMSITGDGGICLGAFH